MKTHPARAYILLADASDLALVIRRGPTKQTCTMLWDRGTDEFTMGQWIKARIYERRCDLSPDGRHMIYFVLDAKWGSPSKGTYTAFSRTPYLKALGFWPDGWAYSGGGAFIDDKSFWLRDSPYPWKFFAELLRLFKIQKPPLYKPIILDGYNYLDECPIPENPCNDSTHIEYHRLLKQGWKPKHDTNGPRYHTVAYEKVVQKDWLLTKYPGPHKKNRPVYYNTYELTHQKNRARISSHNWYWADYDAPRERLIWVENGILFAAKMTDDEMGQAKQIYDFNPMKFEAIKAPY